MSFREVKEYLTHHHISQLLESLLTGLLYHQPEDPLSFLQSCLIRTGLMGGPGVICWDTFIHLETQSIVPPQAEAGVHSQTPESFHLPLIKPQIPPKTTHMPSTTLQIPPGVPQILPKTTPMPLIPAQITPLTAQISHTSLQSLTKTSSVLQQSPPILPKTTQIASIALLTPPSITPQIHTKTPVILSITSKALSIIPQVPEALPLLVPLNQCGPQVISTGGRATILPTVPPSSSHKILATDTQTTMEQRQVHTSPPGPGTEPRPPAVHSGVVRDEAPALRSQVSIDSDSDMTESFGLLQEVSVLCPQRPRPLIIFIIGGPGSGKSSQAAKLEQHFGLRCVSLDELLRKQLLNNTSPSRRWELISQVMSHGELGTQEDTVSQLKQQLIGELGTPGFVVEGFPPDVHQALSFQEQVGIPELVILLLCSNETLRCRLQRRAAQLGLLGDSGAALRSRLERYRREAVSISRYYRQLDVLTQVNADRNVEAVFADVASVVKEKLF